MSLMIFIAPHPQEIIVDLGSMVQKIQYSSTRPHTSSHSCRNRVSEGKFQQVGRGGGTDKVDTMQRVLSQTM